MLRRRRRRVPAVVVLPTGDQLPVTAFRRDVYDGLTTYEIAWPDGTPFTPADLDQVGGVWLNEVPPTGRTTLIFRSANE